MVPLVALLGATLVSACGPRYRHVAQRSLRSRERLECSGFIAWNHEPVRDVFVVVNGSGSGSNAFVHPAMRDMLSAHRVAYASYDKPGIRAPFEDTAAVQRDFAIFERYTLGHGTACAIDALRWAHAQFGSSMHIHVIGHSEGTLVSLYAYDALLDEDPALAAQIRTIVLSGLALEPLADIFARQLAALRGGERLRAAFASCDQNVINNSPFAGTSCAYLRDAAGRPSGRAMFERLASRARPVQMHVVHGESDANTPIGPVRELEAWNTAVGHLPITFRYVTGGHNNNPAAGAEIARVLRAIVAG